MNEETFRELLHRDPFQPFRVTLNSGQSYDVLNPELVVPMRLQLFIALPDGERFTLCPYRNIASVETVRAA